MYRVTMFFSVQIKMKSERVPMMGFRLSIQVVSMALVSSSSW